MATHSSVLAWRIPGTEEPVDKALAEEIEAKIREKCVGGNESIEDTEDDFFGDDE